MSALVEQLTRDNYNDNDDDNADVGIDDDDNNYHNNAIKHAGSHVSS